MQAAIDALQLPADDRERPLLVSVVARAMSRNKARVGVILSAGGSAFAEAARIAASLPLELFVLTDRPCGAEARCAELAIPVTRITENERDAFSWAARQHFASCGAEAVLLHFSRLVGPELYQIIPCCNVHPSLLPAFSGFGAVERAWAGGVRFVGATLHLVDESIDMGPIVAQTTTPVPLRADLAWCERASFLQKTLLTLLLLELIADGRLRATTGKCSFDLQGLPWSPRANPALTDAALIDGFLALQSGLGFDIYP